MAVEYSFFFLLNFTSGHWVSVDLQMQDLKTRHSLIHLSIWPFIVDIPFLCNRGTVKCLFEINDFFQKIFLIFGRLFQAALMFILNANK